MLGVLPKEYKLLKKGTSGQDHIAGGKVNFIGFDFLREVRCHSPPSFGIRPAFASLLITSHWVQFPDWFFIDHLLTSLIPFSMDAGSPC